MARPATCARVETNAKCIAAIMRTFALTTLSEYCLVAALFAGFFADPNPITSFLPLALRTFLIKLPQMLLMDTLFIYITLPQAILLWTEPTWRPSQKLADHRHLRPLAQPHHDPRR